MKILLTFDYELYFGESTGTQQLCMIRPTDELIKIAARHGVAFSFFADCGYLARLEQLKDNDNNLNEDYQAAASQLKQLATKGHDVQLHIHPHWEDSSYSNKGWKMDISRYRLHQFPAKEIERIISDYAAVLTRITGQALHTFRAGGWCLQPFDALSASLKKAGIRAESSVFREGYEKSEHYFYDFRNCPDKDWWRFEADPVTENENGSFIEIPIHSLRVSPLFYWKLYLLGRLNPSYHKPIGDGKPMLSKGYKKRLLTQYTKQVLSVDGYNARLLQRETDRLNKKGSSCLVVIGHPKALSPYSLKMIDEYIARNKGKHRFITYSEFIKEHAR